MRVRLVVLMMVLLALSACGGGAPATDPSSTGAAGPGGTASAAPISTETVIDLSGVDACALLTMETVEALTGETDFVADDGDQKCFWAVPRPGVPQYVELEVFALPNGLASYNYNPGDGCTSSSVAGVGAEAKGGTCSMPQEKVFLVAWARGVAIRVLVNEPKGPLTPADLAATAQTLLEQFD